MSTLIRLWREIQNVKPSGLLRLYLRMKKELDSYSQPELLDRLNIIRKIYPPDLENSDYMERLIPRLGLYPHEEWSKSQFPQELWPSCGQGLGLWQYPNQFGHYLAFLGKSMTPIKHYLEIGVAGGGTFITTMEYLRRFDPNVLGVGIDPALPGHVIQNGKNVPSPFVKTTKAYFDNSDHNCRFLLGYSQRVIPDALRRGLIPTVVDLVLIDGDHEYSGCMADYEMVKPFANIIVFHDIVNDDCRGVGQVWESLKRFYPLTEEYDFVEFVNQYSECQTRQRKKYLGIGVMIRKKWFLDDE